MQSQAGLSFAGQQQHRHGKRILAVLLMLVMAVTGAWADIDTHWPDFNRLSWQNVKYLVASITIDGEIITADYDGWDQLEVAAFVGDECRGAGESVNYLTNGYVVAYGDPFPVLDGMYIYYMGDGGETVTFKMYNHATGVEYTTYTLTYLGEPISILTGEGDHGEGWDDPENPIFLNFTSPASATYNVDMQAGTEDGTSWTAKAGEGQFQQLPLTGVAEGTLVTVAYGGKKRVKSIKVLPDMRYEPLTVEALTDGKVRVYYPKSGMKCLKNGDAITWTNLTGNNDIDVVAGDKLQFYGNGTSITSYNNTRISGGTADGMADVKVYGNIMSLVDEEGFATATTLTATSAFASLFHNYKTLKDASGLVLPATTLAEYCYSNMFGSCSSLTAVPALPATTLASYCYQSMFYGCSSLTTVPALPATTLVNGCYSNMFNGCTGLTTVPEQLLPATTMTNNCYQYMFQDCRALTTVPALPATTLANFCYSYMFSGCTGLTTVPEQLLPVTSLADYCYQSMFSGCTGLTTVPALPATSLANTCYGFMFQNCRALTTVPEQLLPATTLASNCYNNMFQNCTALTASPLLPATTLASNCYTRMFYGCSNLSTVTCLASAPGSNCFSWLYNVAASGTFYAPSTANYEGKTNSSNGIPSGWTRVDYVAE